MGSRAVVRPLNQENRGEMNQKNVMENVRTRRVLGDIGNFATQRAVQSGKNPKAEAAGGNGVLVRGVAAPKKTTIQTLPKSETTIVISPKAKNTSETLTKTPKRKGSKTFSGTLTARSKAAAGPKHETKEKVIDIDASDSNNELAAVDYVDDIYKFYKIAEDEVRTTDYMDSQPEINSKMRSILIDWLIEVHRKFELMPETLFLAVNIVDRYLSAGSVGRKELQLLGISSMLIACKYEEVWAPEVSDFVCLSDNAYAAEDVLVMEKSILERLQWYLTVPTGYVFLARFVKAAVPCDNEMENMAFFLAELGLVQYQVTVAFCPSMVAASAVYAARKTLNRTPSWTETLRHHTGYTKDQLLECAKMLVKSHAGAGESKLRAAYKKYSIADNGGVALLAPAKNLLESSFPAKNLPESSS